MLNAKEHAEREAEIIKDAGRVGAVTIATNMAGRGVDIKMGGDREELAVHELKKQGRAPGEEGYEEALRRRSPSWSRYAQPRRRRCVDARRPLHLGTERHESRRIDNQLRGRSGRQGDPGETRFYLSGQDDLVRLFAGDRIYNIMDRFKIADDAADGGEDPLQPDRERPEEGRGAELRDPRKNVLKYDDVMNAQRMVIYKQRRAVLEGQDISETAREKWRP